MIQCKIEGCPVLHIQADRGGELAKCSKVCELLIKKYKCTLQTTAGYSSWLNGKIESHNKTLCQMIQKALFDSGLPQKLWCLASEECNKTYQHLYHDAAKYSPAYLWYGIEHIYLNSGCGGGILKQKFLLTY